VRSNPIDDVVALLDQVVRTQDPTLVLSSAARGAAHRLAAMLDADDRNLEARQVLGWWHWYRYLALPDDEDQEAWDEAVRVLTKCFVADVADLPEPLVPVLAHHASDDAEELLDRAVTADDVVALEAAVSLWRRIVAATPPDNPRLRSMLSNLAVALQYRHRWLADSADLGAAVDALRRAVSLPGGNPAQHAAILSNLAGALHARFSATGSTGDLDEAIALMRSVLTRVPPGDPTRVAVQANLSSGLATRFERRGSRPDLDEAVTGLLEAASTSMESDRRSLSTVLSSLGVTVCLRFDRTGEATALDLAIKIGRLAADVLPPGQPGRHRVLSNLAGSLHRRAEHTGTSTDLDAAVDASREAVTATPPGHDDAAVTRSNLTNVLLTRYQHGRDVDDLDEAIDIAMTVVAAAEDEDPVTATYLVNLGRALEARFGRLAAEDDRARAVRCLTRAAASATAAPSVRINAARHAAMLTGRREPDVAAAVLERAVDLVPRVASRHLELRDQGFALRDVAGLARDAAALSVAAQHGSGDAPARVLRLLELGRGVMLGQTLDARGDLADLHTRHPGWARRLAELRDALDGVDLVL
jgi:tetratricopeptide (TPR) repeat protein